jgi:hypothetical protein
MASWKRLTDLQDIRIDVNVDQVCYMAQHKDFTRIHFAGSDLFVAVKEPADEIRAQG